MLEAAALDALAFELTRLRLLALAGERRFLAPATNRLEELTGELKSLEVLRAMAVEELACKHGLNFDASLSELAASVEDDAARATLEHCRRRMAEAWAQAASRRDQALKAVTAMDGHWPGGGRPRRRAGFPAPRPEAPQG